MADDPTIDKSCLEKANAFIKRNTAGYEVSNSEVISKSTLIGNLATEVYHDCISSLPTPTSPNSGKYIEKRR